MNIDEALDRARTAKKLADKGTELIASLRTFIEDEFSEHITILAASTKHRLYANFFGLPLLFRIEVGWGGEALSATISAYVLSEVAPKEHALDVNFPFDRHGNIQRKLTKDEFSPYFLQAVFTSLHTSGMILKP